MKIGIIAPPWVAIPPRAYGGTEAVLDGLARGLQADGHSVLLYTTGDSTCPVPKAWTYEKAIGVGVAGESVIELRHSIEAYAAMRRAGVDVVHDHTLVGPVYAAHRVDGLPIATTNHGPFLSDLHALYAALAGEVSIVAISHHQASTAGTVPIAAVIHHGLDVDAIELGAGDGGYALFLGRMTPEKGAHVAAAVARRAGVPLKIAAKMREPKEYEYFKVNVEPLLGDGIEHVGEVGGDEKRDLLANAMCLLNPIEWPEPFGMVMIEALACGTPVVTRANGAAPEIVDHGLTGFLCADEGELEVALGKVGDLERGSCRDAVVKRFSSARMVADHVVLFGLMVSRA